MLKTIKRLIRTLLVVFAIAAAAVTAAPAPAQAAVRDVSTSTELTYWLTNAASGDTLRLMSNIDHNSGVRIENKSFILNLNSYTLNITNTSTASAEGAGLQQFANKLSKSI